MPQKSKDPKKKLHDPKKDMEDGRYPDIKCVETESGHVSVWCDTKGATYILHAHQSGTYNMITHDGKQVNFTSGDLQQYGKGGASITVDENQDMKIHGHQRVVVGGGSYVEVAGHAGIGVAGDTTLFSKGNMNAHVDNFYVGAKGNFKMHVDGNWDVKVKGDTKFDTAGDMSNKVGESLKIDVSDTIDQKSNKYKWEAETKVKGDITEIGYHVDSRGPHVG